ncbi:MAG: phage tail protein, partial [Lachnospiraceae bacterium]|nr:phage tail protein [Lachnospiraceae bacterium]
MLKIYDQFKNIIGYTKAYTDLCIESELESGDKTLSFTGLAKKESIQNEYYIETEDDWYVVKEIGISSGGYPEYTCQLDLEDLEAGMVESFSAENVTCEAAANLALVGTGWTVDTDIEKLRSVATLKATPLTILGKIRDAFMCEIRYDTKNKIVYFREEFGEDKGVFFTKTLNLRKVKMSADTYDYYTRIVPIGADNLRIDDVNDGIGYVENYQYSNKIRTLIWEDTSYEDADALKEDAVSKLGDLSKPKKSYSADIVDLAKQKSQYAIMDFGLGDTVQLLDEETGIKDRQRIVKLTEYPDNPWKNTCELSNTTLTWEELQSRLEAAANAFEKITNSDGTVNGYYVYGVTADGVVVIETSIGEDGSTTTTSRTLSSELSSLSDSIITATDGIVTINGELDAVSARIGSLETTALTATEADLKYATIENLDVANADISTLNTRYANITSAIIGEAAVNKLIAGEAEIATADIGGLLAKYADIELSNVAAESVGRLFADVGVLKDVTIVDGYVTGTLSGVTIYGDCIVANTIVADALVLKGTDGLYYAINATSDSLTASQLTDEKYQNYIDGSVIVAKSITADRIAAGTITADSGIIADAAISNAQIISLDAAKITSGYIDAARIEANSITADKIDTTELFSQDITATGTIIGATFVGATGDFSGDVAATSFLLAGVELTVESRTIEFFAYDTSCNPSSSVAIADVFVVNSANGMVVDGYTKLQTVAIDTACISSGSFNNLCGGAVYANTIYVTGGDGDVRIWSDGEGGNIRIYSPSAYGGFWEIDSYDSNLRAYHADSSGNLTYYIVFGTNGSTQFNGSLFTPCIELSATYPFIDFHNASSSSDYTSRIIEWTSGALTFDAPNGCSFSGSITSGSITATNAISATGGDGNVNIYSDGEGGNIEIYSPSAYGGCWGTDSFNGNLRFYHIDSSGNYICPMTWGTDNIVYASTFDVAGVTTHHGSVTFANGILNLMGDDCYIGDQNQAGCICIMGNNGNTGLYFIPYSGSTSQYIVIDGSGSMNISGTIRVDNEIQALMTSGYAQFRAIAGNYGFMIRNDSSMTYFLLTNAYDQYGAWNDLRPFAVNNSDGTVYLQTTVYAQGALYFIDWSGTSRRPVASISGDGNRTSAIGTNSGLVTVYGQYGTAGSTYSSANISVSSSDIRLKDNIKSCEIEALP